MLGAPMGDSLSVYMQVYRNPRATFEALRSFRSFYRREPITVVSDGGEDFSEICNAVGARFIHSKTTTTTQRMTLPGVYEYLARIYAHCQAVDSKWVVLFEDDVRTVRTVRDFPLTDCAGPRFNIYHQNLTKVLVEKFGSMPFGYGMCGGSVFNRQVFIDCYEANRSLEPYVSLDERVSSWSDLPLTLLFQINGRSYSVWSEVSEIFHPTHPIIRDAAFDHAYKYWYDKPFTVELLLAGEQ
jgi:hypothetical protein